MKKQYLIGLTVILGLFSSCKKDDKNDSGTTEVTTGVYVLSEGNFNQKNTTLTYYSFTTNTPVTDIFKNVNGNGLGDTGNDILLYGGKMYIVMNVSSYVQVAEAGTAKAIKRIEFEITPGGTKRLPRYALPYKNKVLVSSFDGTVAVIDTATLSVEKWITVGANPDGMAISGNKLYVANSGGFNPEFDSTLSVVDLSSYTETLKIKVGLNPGSVAADNSGNVYVACTGNYDNVKAKLVKVNTSTNTVVKSADTAVGKIRYYNGLLYTTGGYLGSAYVRTLSTENFTATRANFVTDGTVITLPYGINVDEENGDVYVTDSKDYSSSGVVFCFDKTGKKKFSFSVAPGTNPNTVALIKK